uniref:26S proteasome non-ATPase regulatory subunit 2 homolog n=2 Tax=Rhizochromulina marina TaxID=1034831 RepID=A0A7S2R9L3_9STRA|mmetsp:Transcript_12555/g.36384  ORF Transcript_12555/g.36384 Transcript_12555/m.36384 type:complete len:890 (+) Transcript_12555:178-2847(+)
MEDEKKEAVAVPVEGKEGKGEAGSGKKKDVAAEEDEMSPEDRALLEGLELAVERTKDADHGVVASALEHLRKEIRSSTTSMTSVPKPLKFLRPHYGTLKGVHGDMADSPVRRELADILSVLAMTMAAADSRESLKYKLEGNRTDLGSWGHEYVRSLAGEIGQEYAARLQGDAEAAPVAPNDDLLELVYEIVPFHLQHNAEAEAVDLLIEVQRLGFLVDVAQVDVNNFERICLYLIRCADFMSDPDDFQEVLHTAFTIYTRQRKFTDALRVAIRLGDMAKVGEVMTACEDVVEKKQLCFILARHRVNYEDEDEDMNELIGNNKLTEYFLHLARDLDVMEPKTPEDIYKSHLSETAAFTRRRDTSTQVDSARSNLASTFVNAFVNAGFGKDTLVTPEDSQWLYKNKEHGMMSAAASLGMIYLWNLEEGLVQLDKYLYTKDDYIKAGAVLGIGIVGGGVRNESDPQIALLPDFTASDAPAIVRRAACTAFGIAFAGSARADVLEYLMPIVQSEDSDIQTAALAALALGQIYVGTCDEDVSSSLVQRLMECSDEEFEHPACRFLCLALGLLFLGRMEKAEAILEAVKTISHNMGQYAALTLESCAFAGTGNVLKVQRFLHVCAEHLQEKNAHQSAAVLGIAMVALGEDVGSEMALRAFGHLLHYGELPIRRAVPLALALLNVSNPDYAFVDQMSRLSHDNDAEVSQAAIIGLGLLGAGTNNSRIAGLLRQLAEHSRDPSNLFVVRIAQGLLHMGKGLVTLNPYHSDRVLMSGVTMGGLLTVVHACLDMKNTILDKLHYILFYLTNAMNPRMLITTDEDLEPFQVSVRVGQAVETVGQAGKPKSISGFQTHTTPVLLAVTERAELADQEYLPVVNHLEGIVILRKNPDFEPMDA